MIKGEEEQEIEKILNKRRIREKDKYLVYWKGFTAESNAWEGRENLKNAKKAIKEFEKEYQQDMEDIAWQEHEEGTFRRGELPGRFTVKKLFGWLNKRYNQEYWGKFKRNWRQWKEKQSGRRKIETIAEKEETKKENLGAREWTEDDDDEMGNIVDLYYKLQENSSG